MNEEITRFDMDMDGSMEPSKHGRWVRYEDVAQPQREWVGLTQEDIDIAFDDTQEGGGFNEFAEAIEQTLRRKNS